MHTITEKACSTGKPAPQHHLKPVNMLQIHQTCMCVLTLQQQQESIGSDFIPMRTGSHFQAAQLCEHEIFLHNSFWETATSHRVWELPLRLCASGVF